MRRFVRPRGETTASQPYTPRGAAHYSVPRSTVALLVFAGLYIGWVIFTVSHYKTVTTHPAPSTPGIPGGSGTSASSTVSGSAGSSRGDTLRPPPPAEDGPSGSNAKAECVTWSIKLQGERYTHGWSDVTYNGLATDTFKTVTVLAGSDKDPDGGKCENYHLDQKVLVTETGYLVATLSCSNQEIQIVSQEKKVRTCGFSDRRLLDGLTGQYSPNQKGPEKCAHLYECFNCLEYGTKDLNPKKVVSGEGSGTKCVWCAQDNACKPYKDSSGSFPCSDAIGSGGGYPGGDACPASAGAKYLSFPWNNGRVNNNMVSWGAAMAMGKHLGRIVILTQPIQKGMHLTGEQHGDPNHGKSAFLGILEDMWDLEFLQSNGFRVVKETDVGKEIMSQTRENTPIDCRIHTGFPSPSKFSHCKIVYMTNPFSYKSLRAQKPKEFIIPAKWIRDASLKIIEEKLGGHVSLSLHQRHHNWGNAETHGSKFLCRGSLKNIFTTNIGTEYRNAVNMWTKDKDMGHKMLEMTQLSCAVNYEEAKQVVNYWKQDMPSRFFLASDREEKDRFESMINNGGVAITQQDYENLPQITEALEKHLSFGFDCKKKYCANKQKFLQLTGVFLDMWGMTLGKFFMGGYYSTMSDTVCFWRGWDRMNASNICFLPHRLSKKWVRPGIDIAS